MKKFLALLLSLSMVLALSACGGTKSDDTTKADETKTDAPAETATDFKVGFIMLHDENSTYDLNFINAAKEACEKLGVEYKIITNVPEGQECYDKAAELADDGCNIIFADSFGHEDYMIQAAKEFPNVQFCHSTGTKAHTEGLSNYHNAFASIYEGRYLAGVAAGMKLNDMIANGYITEDQAKMGYVGAFTYAEVISGYTSFYLGAKSVCPSVTMDVTFTGSWYDETAEKEGANKLIEDGCVLISQHADTTGAPSTCEDKKVPCVGYNVDMTTVAPDAALTSPTNNWGVYYTHAVQCVLDGTAIETDWCQGFAEGAVDITPINEAVAAEGTDAKVTEVENAIKDGSLHVFDTSAFTVNGSSLEDLIAEGGDYAKYADYVSDGYYHESELASAPSFDIIIDGITSVTN